MAKLKGR